MASSSISIVAPNCCQRLVVNNLSISMPPLTSTVVDLRKGYRDPSHGGPYTQVGLGNAAMTEDEILKLLFYRRLDKCSITWLGVFCYDHAATRGFCTICYDQCQIIYRQGGTYDDRSEPTYSVNDLNGYA